MQEQAPALRAIALAESGEDITDVEGSAVLRYAYDHPSDALIQKFRSAAQRIAEHKAQMRVSMRIMRSIENNISLLAERKYSQR